MVVILIAIQLVVGYWVTPVQANNVGIVTPMPTGTPITDPNGHVDAIPVEQQEELKAVIQAYFDIRYNAFSASQPHGFRLDGFGDLISDMDEAKVFLSQEMSKLAVEIKRTRTTRA